MVLMTLQVGSFDAGYGSSIMSRLVCQNFAISEYAYFVVLNKELYIS